MSEDITANIALLPLDELNIGLHTLSCECLSEGITDVCVRMETGELLLQT